jgi:hypothetical protein
MDIPPGFIVLTSTGATDAGPVFRRRILLRVLDIGEVWEEPGEVHIVAKRYTHQVTESFEEVLALLLAALVQVA